MEEQPCDDAKPRHEEMVADFLARWHTSRMTEQDRQVATPDMVLDVDYIAQTSPAQAVHPASAAFRLTAVTQTATDPRSSASPTYTTVFSGYVPRGCHTVSLPVVTAPWTAASVSYAPYALHRSVNTATKTAHGAHQDMPATYATWWR